MGEYWVVNSEQTKENVKREIDAVFLGKKYARIKIDAGKRTLSQNAMKAVWYCDIAKHRGDVNAKDVERECKYKYGLPIIRRNPMQNYVHEQITDKLIYEKRIKVMDCFAVTSIMSVSELKEYLTMMQNDYPYLTSEK